jgi:chromosome segregation ATPase
MRLAISSAIDAQPEDHPAVLTDLQDGSLLVFATIENVLPDPETSWSGERYENYTSVRFGDVGWLDAAFSKEISSNLQARVDELEPGILDARNQLAETQRLVDEASNELKDVSEEINLIERELELDERDSKKSKGQHTHKLPRAVTEKAKRPSQGGKTSQKIKHTDSGLLVEINQEIEQRKRKGFFRRIFGRKGRS